MISHITLDREDDSYDHREGRATFTVTVHHRDGRTEPSVLKLEPGQVEVYARQLGRAIDKTKAAKGTACR